MVHAFSCEPLQLLNAQDAHLLTGLLKRFLATGELPYDPLTKRNPSLRTVSSGNESNDPPNPAELSFFYLALSCTSYWKKFMATFSPDTTALRRPKKMLHNVSTGPTGMQTS
jgi:hypothetical protein